MRTRLTVHVVPAIGPSGSVHAVQLWTGTPTQRRPMRWGAELHRGATIAAAGLRIRLAELTNPAPGDACA